MIDKFKKRFMKIILFVCCVFLSGCSVCNCKKNYVDYPDTEAKIVGYNYTEG